MTTTAPTIIQPQQQQPSSQQSQQLSSSSSINTKFYFLRFKNFPPYITKQSILSLLHLYQLTPSDIVISYNIFGHKTGDAIIRNIHERNHREILSSFKFYYYNSTHFIEITDSNENDFESCKKSELFKANPITHSIPKIFIKMTRIPYSTKEEDIKIFFKNYTICEDGIKINKHKKGNSTGEAVIAFVNEKETNEVLSRENGRILMNQMVVLEEGTIEQFEEFASSSAFQGWIKELSDYISPDEVIRSLFIAGLPLDVSLNCIVDYLQVFNINKSNLVVNEKLLRENGSVIIKFYNEDDANEAKEYINKEKFTWNGRNKKLKVENLLIVVNKGNES